MSEWILDTPEIIKNWARERYLKLQSNSYYEYLRLHEEYRSNNLKQAARIMELELEIKKLERKLDYHRKRWEDVSPQWKRKLGLGASKWVKDA